MEAVRAKSYSPLSNKTPKIIAEVANESALEGQIEMGIQKRDTTTTIL